MVDDEAQEEISAKKSACVFKEEGERSVIESAPENKERARSTAAVGKKKTSDKWAPKTTKAALLPLPEGHQQLLDLFVAIDHAYCFLAKNSIPPKVANLQKMVWHLFPGRFGDEASFLPRLKRIAGMAHKFVILEEQPDDQVDDEYNPNTDDYYSEARRLELRFAQPQTAGVGKAKIAKRQQFLRQALSEHAESSSKCSTKSTSAGAGGECSEAGIGPAAAACAEGAAGAAGAAAATGSSLSTSGRVRDKKGGGDFVRGDVDDNGDLIVDGVDSGSGNGGTTRSDGRRNERKARAEAGGKRKTATAGAVAAEFATAVPDAEHPDKAHPGSRTRLTAPSETEAASSSRRRQAGRVQRQGPAKKQEKQQATGTAISLFAPLSDSPAYVLTGGENKADSYGGEHASSALDGGGFMEEEKLRFDPGLALEHLQSLPMYDGQAVHTETLPGREGEFADTTIPLHPEVTAALAASKGVTRLFKHQALAIDAAMAGRHVALSTATSSGKSVVFNVSVLEAIIGARPTAVALYLFPTKALAQDQLRSLREMVDCSPYLRQRVRPMTLDGDTPWGERDCVMEEGNIILTNPDMLHASALPGHKRFRRILANLSHVVIDEAHIYRGAFGAHVSMVLRRLLRLWALYASPGPPPQFICCSATMRNPPAHFASLLPLEECLGGRANLYFGSADTAPTGRKTFVLWQPPVVADFFKPPTDSVKVAGGGRRAGFFEQGDRGGIRRGGKRKNRSRNRTATDSDVTEVGERFRGEARKTASGTATGEGPYGNAAEKEKMSSSALDKGRRGGKTHSSPPEAGSGEEEDINDQPTKSSSLSAVDASIMATATVKEAEVTTIADAAGAAVGGSSVPRRGTGSGLSPSLRSPTLRRKRKAASSPGVNSGIGDSTPVSSGHTAGGAGRVPVPLTPLSVPRLEGWRKGPKDNYYDREYKKLMDAVLPRPPVRSSFTVRSGGSGHRKQHDGDCSDSNDVTGRSNGHDDTVGQTISFQNGVDSATGGGVRQAGDAASIPRQRGCNLQLGVGEPEAAAASVAEVCLGETATVSGVEQNGKNGANTSANTSSPRPPAISVTLRQVGGEYRGGGGGGRRRKGNGKGYNATKATPQSAAEASLDGSIMGDTAEAAALAQATGGPTVARAGSPARQTVGSAESGEQEDASAEDTEGIGRGGNNGDGVGGVGIVVEGEGSGWEDGRRRSPLCETANLLTALVKQRVKTLAFCRTRKLTELTLRYGRQDLEKSAPQLASLVQGYRGGYTKSERRKIEGRLFANKLLGVTATCALELGVDIGELDVTLHLGFPGSVSSLRQQAGRAGRGGTDSLAIMVLFQDPISQFFVRNPEELLHKEPEAAVLNSNNELVLGAHLLCAAAECPLGVPKLGDVNDAALFGGQQRLSEVIETMADGDFPCLVQAAGGLGWKANPGLDPPPCRRVGLRMIDPITFIVVNDLREGEVYDSVEYSRAFFTLFEGAIYLHQAQQYLVTRLDLSNHVAHTRPVKVNYYTAACNKVDVNVTKRLAVSECGHAHTGCVDVVATVVSFVKMQMGTGMTIERRECSLPPLQYATRAFWLDVGVTAKTSVEGAGLDFEGGIHAVGHALLAVVPLFLLCDASDVDCEHIRPFQTRPKPQRILVFDKRPGGVGVSDAMFACHRFDWGVDIVAGVDRFRCNSKQFKHHALFLQDVLDMLGHPAFLRAVLCKALELVEGCPCPDGCLACIHDHACTGYNSIIDKEAALMILKGLIQDMMDTGDDGHATTSPSLHSTNQQQKADLASTRNKTGGNEDEITGNDDTVVVRRRRVRRNPDQSDPVDEDKEEGAGGYFLGVRDNDDDAEGHPAGQEVSGGGRGSDGGSGKVDNDGLISPRKKQRLRNLHVAKVMGKARGKDISVMPPWIPSVP